MEDIKQFDDIFGTIGSFGTFQVIVFILIGINAFLNPEAIWVNFTAYEPEHWCYIEELSKLPFNVQKTVAIPLDTAGKYDQCDMYNLNYSLYEQEDFLSWDPETVIINGTETIPCTNGWVYDQGIVLNSIVTEYDLVCEDEWWVGLASTLFLFGGLLATTIVGILADKFGRRLTYMGCIIIKIFGNVLSAFVRDFYVYMAGRLIAGIGSIGGYPLGICMLTEFVGPSYRNITGIGYSSIFSLGFMALPAVGYFVRDYMNFQIVWTIPMLVMIPYYFLIPESPRWLLLQGRCDEGFEVLRYMSAVNGRKFPSSVDLSKVELQEDEETSSGSFLDLVRTPTMRKWSLVLIFSWFTVSLIYFAFSLNAESLAGGIYLNVFLLGLVEIPAGLIFMFAINQPRIGRRLSHVVATLSAGVFCLSIVPIILFAPNLQDLVTGFSLVGKAGSTAAINGLYLYSAELFPTQIRTIGLCATNLWAWIGGMIAPYFGGAMTDIWEPLPSLIYGVLTTCTGILLLLLPETLGRPLPETVEEVESAKRPRTSSCVISVIEMGLNQGSKANTQADQWPRGSQKTTSPRKETRI